MKSRKMDYLSYSRKKRVEKQEIDIQKSHIYKKYEIQVCCVRKENPHEMITINDVEYFSIIIYILETKNLI